MQSKTPFDIAEDKAYALLAEFAKNHGYPCKRMPYKFCYDAEIAGVPCELKLAYKADKENYDTYLIEVEKLNNLKRTHKNCYYCYILPYRRQVAFIDIYLIQKLLDEGTIEQVEHWCNACTVFGNRKIKKEVIFIPIEYFRFFHIDK